MTIQRLGSISFALAISALGILHLLTSNFQNTRPDAEATMVYAFLEFLFWAGLIVLSIGILLGNRPHVPAKVMGSLMFIWIFIRHIPVLISDLTNPAEWNFTCMALAICAGAFIVAGSSRGLLHTEGKFSGSIRCLPLVQMGQILLGAALLILGFQHLYYAEFISSMIPFWIPLKIYCTWITGIALMLAGTSFLFNVKISPASFALSLMVLSWIIMLHLPRIISRPGDLYEWIFGFQAMAIATGALTLFGMQRKLEKSPMAQSLTSLSAEQVTVDLIRQFPDLYIPFAHSQTNHKLKGSKSRPPSSVSIER
jgi:uncharacterized membrane protein